MLANLKIENVAVIEKAEVNFTPGFNVLTGETGAGKSILIDSINAILGNRTSRELVRSGAQKACIWATFENIPQSVKKQLEKCGYEANDDLLLYREINAEGKGSCRVNGMPATAAVVRDISSGLLSIHGQHDSQSLTNPALHLGLLDQYAQNRDLFADYYRRYRELVTVKRQLDALNASEADKQRKIEALTAEIDAIDAAALQPGEEKNLQERKTVITHAQGILDGITAAHLALAELERRGKCKAVVTQNIDGLHQKAGSREVLELHGSVLRNYCTRCGKFYGLDAILNSTGVPKCTCGGTIKPDVVLYEEGLDQETIEKSVKYIANADVLIIGGTSLTVYPAAGLIDYYRGHKLVLINKSVTPMDNRADLVISGPIGEVLGDVVGV